VTHFKASIQNSSGATEEVYEKHQQYEIRFCDLRIGSKAANHSTLNFNFILRTLSQVCAVKEMLIQNMSLLVFNFSTLMAANIIQ
jgi:hypothetical protein